MPVSPSLDRFLNAFTARRIPYILFVVLVTAAAAGIAVVLPNWYRAESTLLPPPETSDSFGALTGLIQSSALGSLGLVSTSSTSDVFIEILKSRTLQEAAIRHFGLDQVYRTRGIDRTLGEFRRHIGVESGRSGVVHLTVEDRSAQRAADIANYLLQELDRFNREVYSTRAKRTRKFLEDRLADTRQRLADAQTQLSSYERQNKVVASPDQATVEGAANLMAQKMNLQIRRSYVSEYSGEASPAMRELDAQLSAIESEIGRLPTIKMEGARLVLEVEIQSRLFTLISSQYEEARIQETRDTPTVTVLDEAQVPEIRSRPKRGLIVGLSMAVALALCALYTLLELRSREAS
jgi:uncharacterized protein involved in exopolysaccharide biosynthesis